MHPDKCHNTNGTWSPSLEVNEHHQDCKRCGNGINATSMTRGQYPLRADSEDCNEGEYPNSLRPPHNASDVQGFINPHGFAGKGSRGKGRGHGFRTLTKPLPSMQVGGYPRLFGRVRVVDHSNFSQPSMMYRYL